MSTIVSLDPHFTQPSTHPEAHLAQALEASQAKAAATRADRVELEGGAVVYRDSGAGLGHGYAGYVLLLPNGWKKYYVHRYQAVSFWKNLYGPLFAQGKTEKDALGMYHDPGPNPATGDYSDEDRQDRYAQDSLRRKTTP